EAWPGCRNSRKSSVPGHETNAWGRHSFRTSYRCHRRYRGGCPGCRDQVRKRLLRIPPGCIVGTEVQLDRETCRKARLARDARFDGRFFIGVRTTKIFCRPICPAPSPREENVDYYPSAAAAALAG